MPANVSEKMERYPITLDDNLNLKKSISDSELKGHLTHTLRYKPQDIPVLLDDLNSVLYSQDKAKDLNALWIAVDEDKTDVVDVLLNLLSTEDRLKLLQQEVGYYSIVGFAVVKEKNSVLRLLLNSSVGLTAEILRNKYYNGCTAIHSACKFGNHDALNLMLNQISEERNRVKLLLAKDYFKYTPLHYACKYGHKDTVRELLGHLTSDQRSQMIAVKSNGRTALELAAEEGFADVISIVKTSINDIEWPLILSKCSIIYLAARNKHMNVIRIIRDTIDSVQWYKLLQSYTSRSTPLHAMVEGRSVQMIHNIRETKLSDNQWSRLLCLTDYWGYTPLQYAESDGQADMIEALNGSFKANDGGPVTKISTQHDNDQLSAEYTEPNLTDSSVVSGYMLQQKVEQDIVEHANKAEDECDFQSQKCCEPKETTITDGALDSIDEVLLHKVHGDLHQILAGGPTLQTTNVTTCTLISCCNQTSTDHILLLVKGYVSSIADYLDNMNEHMLKVSTTHSQNFLLAELFIDNEVITPFPSHLVIRNAEELVKNSFEKELLKLNIITKSTTVRPGLLYAHKSLSIKLHGEESTLLTCAILDNLHDGCNVSGSFDLIEIPDEFESMVSLLYGLDEPDQQSDVTAVMMAVRKKDVGVLSLYMFLAGNLANTVEEKREKSWLISTVRLKNDDLEEMLVHQCLDTLAASVPQDQTEPTVENWRKESMFFTVTTSVPKYNSDGIVSLQVLPVSKEVNGSESGPRQCYVFSHPEDKTVCIRIFEPCSPGKAEMDPGSENDQVTISLQTSEQGIINSSEEIRYMGRVGGRVGGRGRAQKKINTEADLRPGPSAQGNQLHHQQAKMRGLGTNSKSLGRGRGRGRGRGKNKLATNLRCPASNHSDTARYELNTHCPYDDTEQRQSSKGERGGFEGTIYHPEFIQQQDTKIKVVGEPNNNQPKIKDSVEEGSREIGSKIKKSHQRCAGKPPESEVSDGGARVRDDPNKGRRSDSVKTGKSKKRMNVSTQKLLETEQTSINRSMRGLHDQSSDRTFNDTVTAIVVSVAEDNQVESRIILFGGLLTSSKGNCLTRGDKTIGATVSLHWLFNTIIREKFRGCRYEGPCYAVIDRRSMEAFHEEPPRLDCIQVASHIQNPIEKVLGRFTLTFQQHQQQHQQRHQQRHQQQLHQQQQNQQQRHQTLPGSMSIPINLPKQYLSLDMDIDGCQITMGLDLQTSPHCVMSLPQEVHQTRSDLIEFVKEALKLESTAHSKGPGVTISVHQIDTPKQQTLKLHQRDLILSQEKYIICAIGSIDELKLPDKVVYHDPRHKWACVSWSENNSSIKDMIEKCWPKDWPESRQLAKHVIYYVCDSKTEPEQLLYIDPHSPDVRYKKRDQYNMEAWSHERKPNSLVDLLTENKSLCQKLVRSRAKSVTRIQECLKNLSKGQQSFNAFGAVKLCHCKLKGGSCEQERWIMRDEKIEVIRRDGEGKGHVSLTTPGQCLFSDKDNQVLSKDIDDVLQRESEEARKLINNYIQENREQLPTSFKLPTIQLKLVKLANPNHMSSSTSADSISTSDSPTKPYVLCAKNDNDCHIPFARPIEQAAVSSPIISEMVTASEAEELVSKIVFYFE